MTRTLTALFALAALYALGVLILATAMLIQSWTSW